MDACADPTLNSSFLYKLVFLLNILRYYFTSYRTSFNAYMRIYDGFPRSIKMLWTQCMTWRDYCIYLRHWKNKGFLKMFLKILGLYPSTRLQEETLCAPAENIRLLYLKDFFVPEGIPHLPGKDWWECGQGLVRIAIHRCFLRLYPSLFSAWLLFLFSDRECRPSRNCHLFTLFYLILSRFLSATSAYFLRKSMLKFLCQSLTSTNEIN